MPVGRTSIYDESNIDQQVLFEEYRDPPWISEWRSMPEFEQKTAENYAEIIVRFSTKCDFEEFQELIGQKINSQKSSIWHPKLVRGEYAKYRWKSRKPKHPRYPIYVLSKGRFDIKTTSVYLEEMNVKHFVVIEPQEEADYEATMPTNDLRSYKVLPFSNLGLGSIPARNFVWEDSKSNGDKRHWILDDNIFGFYRLNKNAKVRVSDGTIFSAAEDFVDRYKNVPMAGFNYDYFCKACDPLPPFYMNTRIYSCILIENEDRLEERWRGRYNEDTDLSLRFLKKGFCTILFNCFLAAKAATMTVKGGNTDNVYVDGDNRMKFAESLKEQHPDVVEVTFKFGRNHHQVNYKPFKSNALERVDGYCFEPDEYNYGLQLEEI